MDQSIPSQAPMGRCTHKEAFPFWRQPNRKGQRTPSTGFDDISPHQLDTPAARLCPLEGTKPRAYIPHSTALWTRVDRLADAGHENAETSDSGHEVRRLQEALIAAGYELLANGADVV